MAGLPGDALRALADQIAVFLALLLLVSALHKGVKWSQLQDVVHHFGGVPASLAPLTLACVAVLEIAACGLLFLPALRTLGALLAAALWSAYLLLIMRAVAQGRRNADCGCSFGAAHRRLGSYHMARNAVLIGLAVGVALERGQVGTGARSLQLLAGCALLALYGALDQVLGLQPLRAGEVS